MPQEAANGQVADRQSRIDAIVLEFLKAKDASRHFDRDAVLAANPDLAEELEPFFDEKHRLPAQRDRGTDIYISQAASDPGNSESSLPKRAGRIQIRGIIDGGGMGDVLLGHDPEIDREVAVKVLLAKHRGDPQLVGRFITEAKINGRLQHPGIAPIYDMGKLDDASPYFAMKLIQGQTLEEMLSERPTPGHYLPRYLKIFEQISETIAYAHSNGIIHRDLKPRNVMVGAFGEVQVMDWGLAKRRQTAPVGACGTADELKSFAETPLPNVTSKGTVIGTLAYMPPEQARGEIELIDERSDVFGLGAILCVILTGQPPHMGTRAQIQGGDLSDAFARLDAASVDAELIALAKSSLAPERSARPANGQAVAEAMSAYIASVEKKRQAAEIELAAAEAKAEEAKARANAERKARYRTMGIAVAALLLLAAIGGGTWWWVGQRSEATWAVQQAMDDADRHHEEAWNAPAGEIGKFEEALKAAKIAVDVAHSRPTPRGLREAAEKKYADMQADLDAAKRDARLLNTALDVRNPRELRKYIRDDKSGFMTELPEPDADEQFAMAFQSWGLDLDQVSGEVGTRRFQSRPPAMGPAVAAILDEWASERRRKKRPGPDWQPLTEMANVLDKDEHRRKLRAIFENGQLSAERCANEVANALLPYTILSGGFLGKDTSQLRALANNQFRELADKPDVADDSALNVLLLSRALRAAGDDTGAEQLLRASTRRKPGHVVLLHTLGQLLVQQRPPRYVEAAECFAAARAVRPDLGEYLAMVWMQAGRITEAVSLHEQMVSRRPDNPEVRYEFGGILLAQNRFHEAEEAYRKAIELRPMYAKAYNNLGFVLHRQKRLDEAATAYRRAIELDRNHRHAYSNLALVLRELKNLDEAIAVLRAATHVSPNDFAVWNDLGVLLHDQKDDDLAITALQKAIDLSPDRAEPYIGLCVVLGAKMKLEEAITACRRAIELKPNEPLAHFNFGYALHLQKKLPEAVAAYRKAIELKPDLAEAHNELGNALRDQNKLDQAVAEYRRAIDLKADLAEAHKDLGGALRNQGKLDEAVAACLKAIELKPQLAEAHYNLGIALADQKKLNEAAAAYRKAIEIKPEHVEAYVNLGVVLHSLRKLDEAVASYGVAIKLRPDDAITYYNLGMVLSDQKNLAAAAAAFRKAIELQPDDAMAHYNLGNVFAAQRNLHQAEAAFRKAIAITPNDPIFHYNLGVVLHQLRRLDEAAGAYREAIKLRPDIARPYNNLGIVLRDQNKLNEAIVVFRKATQLTPWDPLIQKNLRQTERLIELEKLLPAILDDDEMARGIKELIELAVFCKNNKRMYSAAARFYSKAFASEPSLTQNIRIGHRYNAASSSALASAAQGNDAANLDDKERTRLRQQALEWLQADLDLHKKLATSDKPVDRAFVINALQHWQQDPDLASVRDHEALTKLPEAEQKRWWQLWDDVAALLKQAGEPAKK